MEIFKCVLDIIKCYVSFKIIFKFLFNLFVLIGNVWDKGDVIFVSYLKK